MKCCQDRMYYPTKMGCTQDEKDQDYSDLITAITGCKRIAVWNVVNDKDGSFHTLGFIDADEDWDEDRIFDFIEQDALFMTEDEEISIDPCDYIDSEDCRIEFYDPSNEEDLRKITEYLDAMFETPSFEAEISDIANEFDNLEDFCDSLIEMSKSLNLCITNNPEVDSTILISAESLENEEIGCFKHLPILFSDMYRNLEVQGIGKIQTPDDILDMCINDARYDDMTELLRSIFNENGYDEYFGLTASDDSDSKGDEYPEASDEGPSGSSEGDEAPEEQKPVVKQVITTPAYTATKNRTAQEDVKPVATRKPVITNPKTNLNLKESIKMNFLGKLNFQPINAAITMDGLLAIDVNTNPNDEVKYRAVDSKNNLIDVAEETVVMEAPFLMPVMGQNPDIGDFVQQGDTWYKIISNTEALNLANGSTAGLKMKFTQFFKSCVFYRAMFNPSNMMSNGIMMMMLLGNKEDGGNTSFDMKTLMLMSMLNGGNQNMNQLLPLMLLSGDNGSSFDVKTLMLMSMMNGGSNPFANIFGGAAAVAPEAKDEDEAPAKPARRK